MRIYKTAFYQDRRGYEQRQLFYILNEEERIELVAKIKELKLDIEEAKTKKRIKRWNKYDKDAVVFLERMTHYGVWKNSEMLDITQTQMQLIDKMLAKVYTRVTNFHVWTRYNIEPGDMNGDDAKANMQEKRDMKAWAIENGFMPAPKTALEMVREMNQERSKK